jgi:hypothetical protein
MVNPKLDLDELFSTFRPNGTVSSTEIDTFELETGITLPGDYRGFMELSNGGAGIVGSSNYLIIWPLDKLIQMNIAYQVKEYAPGLILFGSNGGGEGYAFDARTTAMPIVSVPFVGMDLSLLQVVARTFANFLTILRED